MEANFMRQTKTIFSIALLTLLSCQNQTKDNQANSDRTKTGTETQAANNRQENPTVKFSRQPRYSIIQSTLAAKGTYKLDSYTGDVYQMVLSSNGNETWDKLLRQPHSILDTQFDNSTNYTLFLSPLAMRFTYLMNVNTGATWQLVQDPKSEENFFSPIQ
ncbi:MAG TPA: hypothetical protein PKA77_13840 [Chitinophagaceae bacterium]|nr:hypothetical protein [Chitinophagaceae bacterium]